jgi:hypothetical protein
MINKNIIEPILINSLAEFISIGSFISQRSRILTFLENIITHKKAEIGLILNL